MKTWSQLREVLEEVTGLTNRIYYQPPENLKINYPCVVFENSNALTEYADNKPYVATKRYAVTLMSTTADNDQYKDPILMLPMCTFDREFKSDGIVHSVFNIYF